MDDNAVSEAIGFILIFSIVVIGIAIVVLYGFPLLLAGQGGADIRNMEQTMIVLQNDLKSISYKMVPYKETALQVSGGVLFVTEESGTFTVERFDGTELYRTIPGKIRYVADIDRTHITIENGAVLTRPGIAPGSALLAEPRWYYDDPERVLILSFIEVRTESPRSLAGVGRIEMKSISTVTTEYTIPDGLVFIRYIPDPDDDYSVAWGNYMKGRLSLTPESEGTYFHSNVETVVIKKIVIGISGI
ncbi:MAG: hypothetical protein Q7J09_04195 [Methanocalculus sp.]|uniref:DUF7289 family protein n=1 Tax=Methanocalculus sp. TaxID=2004547 RepID=UPI00271CD520|nr:hypothetical protein [Methanocalculus sp.]MDO9539188.1 hypothetical protein [Methanocalculus sp.]